MLTLHYGQGKYSRVVSWEEFIFVILVWLTLNIFSLVVSSIVDECLRFMSQKIC